MRWKYSIVSNRLWALEYQTKQTLTRESMRRKYFFSTKWKQIRRENHVQNILTCRVEFVLKEDKSISTRKAKTFMLACSKC